jgi:hypothetical protein
MNESELIMLMTAARMYRALTAAWRKWEADRRHTPISRGIPYVYQTKADES